MSWTSAANTITQPTNDLGDVYRVIVNADGTIRNPADRKSHLPLASYNATPVGNMLSGDAGVNTFDGVSGGALTIDAGADVDVLRFTTLALLQSMVALALIPSFGDQLLLWISVRFLRK
jgi:hypothetical protein